jgi:peptide/nickel transport system permease protein
MILLISIVIFIGISLTPGDPLTRMLSPEAAAALTEAQKVAFRHAMGLDRPVYIQYLVWLQNLLQGNYGVSLISGMSVAKVLSNRVPATFELATFALLISTVFGLAFGIVAAIKQNSWVDYASSVVGMAAISIPEFFLAIIAVQIFAIKLKWLPPSGRNVYEATSIWQVLAPYILPACVLGFGLTAALMRYTRGSMLDVMNKDYVKTARSKGISEWKVYTKHTLRNALMPITLLLCFRLPILIGGSIIIEQVFIWPGMGQALIEAINGKDIPVVLMAALLTSLIVLLASFLVDLFTALLDPRVRMGKQ